MTVTTAELTSLRTLVYPSSPEAHYPELAHPRYDPATHPLAVCFSGGGPRSFAASIGQMRALRATPALYDRIGAISVVSGGSWFGSLFTFADPAIPDDQLLGDIVKPGDINLEDIASVPHTCIGFGLTQASNHRVFDSIAGSILRGVPSNRLYARILNSCYCNPFRIDDVNKFFTLDADAVNALIAANPGLTANDFYVVRPDRPYLVAGATQVFPIEDELVMRHFEYSPLYDGSEQLFQDATPSGAPFGGGFVQNFAMDSSAPQRPDVQGLVSVSAPLHRFTISDMMGSSGAAPGSVLDSLGLPSLFAEFHYWPPQSAGVVPDPTSQKMSIVDGGDLENTGLVAMLRRRYRVIIACINTSTPLNPDWQTKPTKGTYEGVDTQISSLFGFKAPQTTASREIRERAVEMMVGPAPAAMMSMPEEMQTPKLLRISVPQQPIQIFPSDEFAAVQQGLMAALATGGPVWYAGRHTIWPDNPFGIPPYPGDGKVTVVWLYNQKIAKWVSQLQPDVQQFLTSTSKRNYMANFPNYETVFQNKDLIGIPELLLLTPEQVNLIGDMWTWAILEIADEIQKLLP